jgi:hypothetical protein
MDWGSYCMPFCLIGAIYLIFMGVLVAEDASIIHFKPEDRGASAFVLILSGVLYGEIFGGLLYKKSNEPKPKKSAAERWAERKAGAGNEEMAPLRENEDHED